MLNPCKKILVLLVVVVVALSCAVPVQASEVTLEGEIVQGRFLVPMRGIFEALGAEVGWDGETRTVTGVKGDISVKLTIDSAEAFVNEEAIELDVPATIVNGRTFVPTRFVSESLRADVSWDAETRVATITQEDVVIKVHEVTEPTPEETKEAAPDEEPEPTTDAPEIAWIGASDQLINHYRYEEGFLTGSTVYEYFEVTGGTGKVEIDTDGYTNTFFIEEGKAYKLSIDVVINTLAAQYTLDEYKIVINSPSAETPATAILESPYASVTSNNVGKQAITKTIAGMDLELWEYSPPTRSLGVWPIPEGSTTRVIYDAFRRPAIKYVIDQEGQEDPFKYWIYNNTNQAKVLKYESDDEEITATVGPGGLESTYVYYGDYYEMTYYNLMKPVYTKRGIIEES